MTLVLHPVGRPCSQCGEFHDRENQRLCASCHAAYQRHWRRKRTRDYREAVRAASRAEVLAGTIEAGCCMICGAADVELHHPDHESPTLTFWLCRACHMNWHAYWKGAVLNAFCEWVEIARECTAVRKAEDQAERHKEKAA
jgi:hypothetical protein